jgi:tripartite-type tricarboxylate transporter receptor subunit TctC
MSSSHIVASMCVAAAVLVPAQAALAQGTYPDKPIRIIAPVQPGGGVDLVARQIGERLTKALGQSVVVENQSGGGGIVGSLATARAAPDGCHADGGYVGTHGTNPAVRNRCPTTRWASRRSRWWVGTPTCSSRRRRCR